MTLMSIIGIQGIQSLQALPAQASLNPIEITQKAAENQIRHLLDPLLEKYCHDECKLLSVNVSVDIAVPDEIAPGFTDVQIKSDKDLAPTSARLKLLIDDKVGPISRSKLIELLQQYLDTLDYPVKVETQVTHFPQPVGSEGKIADLRERISKQFQSTISELIQHFCPEHCLFVDFNLRTEAVNGEEPQYGSQGEFIQDNGIALRIRDISGTILMDDSLPPAEQENILEMAKLKTNSFKHVNLTAKAMKFPRPNLLAKNGAPNASLANAGAASGLADGNTVNTKKTDTSTSDTKQESLINSQQKSTSQSESTNKSSSNSNNSTTSSSNTSSNSKEDNVKHERFERIEKIERVEQGDAIHAELQKFKFYGLIFACSILSLLIFIAVAGMRAGRSDNGVSTIHRVVQNLVTDPINQPEPTPMISESLPATDTRKAAVSKRFEIERLIEELTAVYAQNPKVAKHVFTRILTEEGLETTAAYIEIFGEAIVIDMLNDPGLQGDISELTEYYAKTPIDLDDEDKLDLLRKLHNRTIAGKLVVMGNRSSHLFDFLAEMDAVQILELIRTESLTVKAIIITQCDPQKRAAIYANLEETVRMKLLTELSRIDYLPRDYVFNVSNALKRKRRDNPKLNTEALPGSEVLVNLLERTGLEMQKSVVRNLETAAPDSARTVKSKLVSIGTLHYLRDSQLLEVILSLKHDELLQFLKGATDSVRNAIFSKSPRELVSELQEELETVPVPSREGYYSIERKILNRMKIMANEGLLNLVETNERMFADINGDSSFVSPHLAATQSSDASASIKKVSGW
jgi:flagellar motor switch protein FliG